MEQQDPKTAPETAAQSDAEQEVPFVPYVKEARRPDPKRTKRWLILLAVLTAAAALLGGFLLYARKHNFYSKTMESLRFDYSKGESVDENSDNDLAVKAEALAEKIGSTVRVQANVCVFNDEGRIAATVSQYDYNRSPDAETLHILTGSQGWIATRETDLTNQDSEDAAQRSFPRLYDYFFTVSAHDSVKASCVESYFTAVGAYNYVCELWLLEAPEANYTLYRYYSGDRLAAVRVLSSEDSIMEVYDITNLTY